MGSELCRAVAAVDSREVSVLPSDNLSLLVSPSVVIDKAVSTLLPLPSLISSFCALASF